MATGLTFGTSSGNKTPNVSATIGTSGGNRNILEGWAGTASGNKLTFPAITTASGTYDSVGTGAAQNIAIRLYANGTMSHDGTELGEVFITDWCSPPTAAPNDWEVRVTVTSGTLTTGTSGSWLALTSNRTWSIAQVPIGSKSTTFTIEIRKASNSVVYSSSSVTLYAERF